MPALPGKSARRKRSTPRKKLDGEDVWQRTFEVLGLKPLSSNRGRRSIAPAMPSATNLSSPSTHQSLAQGSEPKMEEKEKEKKMKTILDLPTETQKDIFKYSSTPDLIALSLVSKHFRGIASERLYRSFHIIFPDEEDPSNELPIDGLAGGLDTFVTSDYNYAQHLREIILESLSAGDKGERAYRQYLYDVSCGKFMNTLLLLTLRKAKALETFKWDIRVELSREVFKALHSIGSLQNLHLRMQAGHSIYQAPPAIPASQTNNPTPMSVLSPAPHHNVTPFMPMTPGFPPGNSSNSFSLGSKISSKIHKNTKSVLPSIKKIPSTLSGFRDLRSLEVLDMDTLDYISEMKTCIGNCSSTLKTLKLSFSDALANKSRKPPPELISDDDSEQEDEFGQGVLPPAPPNVPPPSGAADLSGPSKALKALEEKKNQEGFFAKIFGIETAPVAISKSKTSHVVDNEQERMSIVELRKIFLKILSPVTLKLFPEDKDNGILDADEAEVLAIIRKFSQMSDAIEKSKDGQPAQQVASVGSSTAKATPASSSASLDGRAESDSLTTGSSDEPGLFDKPTSNSKKANANSEISNPDDINIEEPEVQELTIDSEPAMLETSIDTNDEAKLEIETHHNPSSAPMDSVDWANRIQVIESHREIRTTTHEIMDEAEKLKKRINVLKTDLLAGKKMQDDDYVELASAEEAYASYNRRLDDVTRDLQDLGAHMDEITKKGQRAMAFANGSSEMSEYIRSTRGLTLTTLAIYLIPIRASVLSRAIDLTVLQSITLLNVGYQVPFWNVMARENKLSPLPLRKIHTDNVTLPFLAFASQLDTITELLLLERAQKSRVENTTAKTTVTVEQIRRILLKKHAARLKVLMIRNDAGSDWDLNVKTTMLLCHRAKILEELAVSFGVRTMHTFLQFMPGLTSLRALHTIQFRTDDTCVWVLREFRKFTVDNISHNPDMKLEFIALDNTVERLVRRIPSPKKKIDNKGKGKEIAGNTHSGGKKTFAQLILGSGGIWPDSTTMSAGLTSGLGPSGLDAAPFLEDSDDDEGTDWGIGISGKMGLKVETLEGLRFCDVTGVRIFEKDVLGGKL